MELLIQLTNSQPQNLNILAHLHSLNILMHVSLGSVGIILGAIQLLTPKGGVRHRKLGKLFLRCYCVVICSAILGSIFFNFRAFLVVLTFSAAYTCTSGYRVLFLKGKQPMAFDNILSTLGIGFSLAFIYWIDSIPLIMSKTTVAVTVAHILVFCVYDLSRNYCTAKYLSRSWIYEHMLKMISAVGALLSAASGNLLPSYGAVGQLTPSIVTTLLVGLFFVLMMKGKVNLKQTSK